MKTEGAISLSAPVAVRLLLLTGCRKSEILTLRWDWVDPERKCLRLPDSKSGAKFVPLPAAALELLEKFSRRNDSMFVLPASKGDGH
jgi:integrase